VLDLESSLILDDLDTTNGATFPLDTDRLLCIPPETEAEGNANTSKYCRTVRNITGASTGRQQGTRLDRSAK